MAWCFCWGVTLMYRPACRRLSCTKVVIEPANKTVHLEQQDNSGKTAKVIRAPLGCGDMSSLPFLSESCGVCLLVGCLTSQQQASVSRGRVCSDNFTCCHTEIEGAGQTFYLTQSQYTDTGPTSPSADPISPGAWQGSHWSANFEVTGMARPRKNASASGIRTRDLPLSRLTPYH